MDLSFELVDDLGFAVPHQREAVESHVRRVVPSDLGPLVEYVWLRRTLPLPSLNTAQSTPLSDAFRQFAAAPHAQQSLVLNGGVDHDFSCVPTEPDGFTALSWNAFLKRMQAAAERHGFGTQQAAGLVAAFGEMTSNAQEHSRQPASAVAGYKSARTVFEFVIADEGIGAFASLTSCSEYSHIHDPGDALALCMREGVSRHGSNSKRGLGFSNLFARIADLNARIRIRSDNQLIDLRGDHLGPRLAFPATRPRIRGMSVAVQCFPRLT